MTNWTALKKAIANVIKTNGNQEITGVVLQNTLNSIVNSVGENAAFAGIAIPTTNPGISDGPVFYLAFQKGDYSNFGTSVKRNELAILYNTTFNVWNKSTLAILSTLEENVMANRIASNSLSKINKGVLVNTIEFLRGCFISAETGNIQLGSENATYGLRYITVKKGKTYSAKVTSTQFSDYAVLSFSKTVPVLGGKVDFIISTVEETKIYDIDEAFTAIDNGYLILSDWSNGLAKFYEISSDLNLASIEDIQEAIQNVVTKSDLNSKSKQSKNFCDYLKFSAFSDYEFVNDVAPNIDGVFAGNVSRITLLKAYAYLFGVFQSSHDWLQKLKNYQTEDGTPLQMSIKTRVYNRGYGRITIYWGVRYIENNGQWKTPQTEAVIEANSFTDIILSITPNYNDLTTIIDLYTFITGQEKNTVLEFGNMDLYWDDPKKRDSRPIVSAFSIDKGIEFEQLSDNLQKRITGSSQNINPKPKMNIICSGSSITWGDGRLDGSFVGTLDKFIKERLTKTLFSDELEYSVMATKLINPLFYNSAAHKVVGLGAKVNFTLFGDEIAICQAKLRSDTDYGIMTVKANGKVIGTFDNKNFIGSDTETFSGKNLRKIRLKRPCTFDHEITINGSIKLTDIQFNTQGYGGTIPDGCKAFIYRGLNDNGSPVHYIDLSDDLGTITSVTVKYKYGRMIAHERSTVGQTQDPMTNESVYGSNTIDYDPAHPTGGISSGMEFRGIDVNSFFVYKFDTAEMREFEIEITRGNNPYLVLNFVTNRYNNLMNAGIGGWAVDNFTNNDKINDYTQFYKWFMPDVIFQESSTNDDWWYSIRRISRSIGTLSKDALVKLWGLEVSKVTYNSNSDNYSVEMATGLISEVTSTSLKSDDIMGTSTQVGDIVRIGNYYGDNKAVVCRKISEVDTETGTIKWIQPLNPEEILGIDTLDDLVGKEINIRNLDKYKTRYKEFIEKVREVSPQAKIVIVASGLSMYGLRQLWGYDIVHRELCNEYPNMEYCDITDWLHDTMKYRVSGSRKEIINSTGALSYDLTFTGNKNSWQGFKVLIDGIDVYGKTCHIESGYFYHADKNKTGAALNKNGVYNNKGVDDQTIPMKLVFDKKAPGFGKQIEVQYSDTTWSSDYCHPSEYGAFLYSQMCAKFIN